MVDSEIEKKYEKYGMYFGNSFEFWLKDLRVA